MNENRFSVIGLEKYTNRLPPAIEEWRSNVESRRSQPTELPELPVVFKSK
jgi:hypothetical protein